MDAHLGGCQGKEASNTHVLLYAEVDESLKFTSGQI